MYHKGDISFYRWLRYTHISITERKMPEKNFETIHSKLVPSGSLLPGRVEFQADCLVRQMLKIATQD